MATHEVIIKLGEKKRATGQRSKPATRQPPALDLETGACSTGPQGDILGCPLTVIALGASSFPPPGHALSTSSLGLYCQKMAISFCNTNE